MKKLFNRAIAKIVYATAICGAGQVSMWNTYQPKEPAILKSKVNSN